MTSRLWTAGYDIYMPDRDIIFHIYEQHHKRPLFWQDEWEKKKRAWKDKAQLRVLYLLGLMPRFNPEMMASETLLNMSVDLREVDKYEMGTERDIADFWEWIAMDWEKDEDGERKSGKGQKACDLIQNGALERVPTKSEGG